MPIMRIIKQLLNKPTNGLEGWREWWAYGKQRKSIIVIKQGISYIGPIIYSSIGYNDL